MKQGVSIIAANKVYTSTNKTIVAGGGGGGGGGGVLASLQSQRTGRGDLCKSPVTKDGEGGSL